MAPKPALQVAGSRGYVVKQGSTRAKTLAGPGMHVLTFAACIPVLVSRRNSVLHSHYTPQLDMLACKCASFGAGSDGRAYSGYGGTSPQSFPNAKTRDAATTSLRKTRPDRYSLSGLAIHELWGP